jgi:pyridoxine kinase
MLVRQQVALLSVLWVDQSIWLMLYTGYPSHQGTVMNGEELWNLVQGMQESNLLEYTHLLTGYIGSVSFLETIVRIVSLLRERNPDLIYGKIGRL